MSFANTFPAAASESAHWTERVVTQGHADYCRNHGHANWTVDGVVLPTCPRCGEPNVAPTVADLGFPLVTQPISYWAEFAATHPALGFLPGTVDLYPAVGGDELQVDVGPLARTSVVGETSLWAKVTA